MGAWRNVARDVEEAVVGATVAGFQPQANLRVLLDPADHPFCLCLDGA